MSADLRRAPGVAPGVAAIVMGGATSTAIALPAEYPRLAAYLAGAGLLALALGVVGRSERLTAWACVPVLSAAVGHILLSDDAGALWALGVGCGWYLAMELAWESISRRAACRFEPETQRDRTRELLSVIAVSSVLATVALWASTTAPTRTVPTEALVTVGVLFALGATVRRLTHS